MESTPTYQCPNCGHMLMASERYCSQCGQKKDIKEITIRDLIAELIDSFNFERGFLHTFKELSYRPGHAIREYIGGKRKGNMNPMKYLLLVSAIAALVNVFIPFEEYIQFEIGAGEDAEKAEKVKQAFFELFLKITNQYFSALMVIGVPFSALLTKLFFFKHRVNYAKHMVLNAYQSAHILWGYIFIMAIILVTDKSFIDSANIVYMVLFLLYSIFVFIQFFQPKYRIWAVIKTIFFVLFYLILVSLVLGISVGLYISAQEGLL